MGLFRVWLWQCSAVNQRSEISYMKYNLPTTEQQRMVKLRDSRAVSVIFKVVKIYTIWSVRLYNTWH